MILSAAALIPFGWSRQCRHEWQVIATEWSVVNGPLPVATKGVKRCTKCGKMKRVKL
ncbi:hypothetical protein AA0616_2436 [Komagataeibacter nataicola NRIC 0616]|nr:hypothetical protein AA0616_2436 [Komagataeibacter nataicola NRIC 0616]